MYEGLLWMIRGALVVVWLRVLIELVRRRNGVVLTAIWACVFLVLIRPILFLLIAGDYMAIQERDMFFTSTLTLIGCGFAITHLLKKKPRRK